MTTNQLTAICGSEKRAEVFADYLTQAMSQYEINTIPRQAMFLGQIMHESGGLRWVRELASGKAYEGRKDLGNIYPGDGERFRGRGLIMITGRRNYSLASLALFDDYRLLTSPDLLAAPNLASRSAAWWWYSHGLNRLADEGKFKTITRRINGGLNGLEDRETYYQKALEILQFSRS